MSSFACEGTALAANVFVVRPLLQLPSRIPASPSITFTTAE
ncbi:MAG: hypothetical protein KatS3mg022_0894 [Armatimonadota bacterium]|nr:MAG: hypothetical protein KatS3mg022_0894 [Armatimonadota bacterium]